MTTLQEAIAGALANGGRPHRVLNEAQMEAVVNAVTDWIKLPDGDALDVWSREVAPGGMVCAVCGMPTESEPCEEHQPAAWARMEGELDPTPQSDYPCQEFAWYHDGSREMAANASGTSIPKCPGCGQ